MEIEKKKKQQQQHSLHMFHCGSVDLLCSAADLPTKKQNTRWSYRRLYGWKNTRTNRLTSSLMSLLTLKNNCTGKQKQPNRKKKKRNNAHLIFSLIFAFIGPANVFFRSHWKYIKIYIIQMLLFGI